MPARTPPETPATASSEIWLHGWRDPAILAAAAFAVAAGFAQFGVTAALGDVAKAFGTAGNGASLREQVGLSLTTIGIGLAVVRFAALASMPLAAFADRIGRRRMILGCCLPGLALTAMAAGSPTFWWFVTMIALGRPLLSATSALTVVIAAEETRVTDRAKAVALMAAAYGFGGGLLAFVRGVLGLGFRPLFALMVVPLIVVAVIARRLEEPQRYARLRTAQLEALAPRGSRAGWALPPGLRGRCALLAALGFFAVAFVTAPVTTLVFVYAESVLGLTSSVTTALVLAAAPAGFGGLAVGRWATDQLGRRPTAIAAHAGIAVTGAIAYTTGPVGAISGYLACLFAQSVAGPAIGTLAAELFPTSSRATAAGWLHAAGVLGAVSGLVTFGLLADAFASFGPAVVAVALPMGLASAGYLLLPETRGLELEESAPEPDAVPTSEG